MTGSDLSSRASHAQGAPALKGCPSAAGLPQCFCTQGCARRTGLPLCRDNYSFGEYRPLRESVAKMLEQACLIVGWYLFSHFVTFLLTGDRLSLLVNS